MGQNQQVKKKLFTKRLEKTFQFLPRQTTYGNVILVSRFYVLKIQSVTLQELKPDIHKNLNARETLGIN